MEYWYDVCSGMYKPDWINGRTVIWLETTLGCCFTKLTYAYTHSWGL